MSEKIRIDLSDLKAMREVMDKYHTTETMLVGENTEGETTTTSIFKDKIVVVTYQKNGWSRKNILHRDGSSEELYEK